MARPSGRQTVVNRATQDAAWKLFVLGFAIPDVADRVKKHWKIVQKWSVAHGWVEKRQAVLDKRNLKLGADVLKEQESIRGEERAIALELMAAGTMALKKFNAAKCKPGDLVKMLELASKLSRLSAGMPLGSTSVEATVRHDLGDSIKAAIDKVYGAQAKPIDIAVDTKELAAPAELPGRPPPGRTFGPLNDPS